MGQVTPVKRLGEMALRRRNLSAPAASGLIASACAAAVAFTPAFAQSGAPYAGKQIRLVIASGAGGGYDVYARVMASHLVDHIPGHPAIVPENMPGAAGLNAINWTQQVAPRDGSVILSSYNAVLKGPLFHEKAAKFDPRQLEAIGSIGTLYNICVTWGASPIKTLDQAKTQPVTVAAESALSNSAAIPNVLNHMLGTKFKIIQGYETKGMRLAVERGEAQATCLGYSTLLASDPQWFAGHEVNVLVQTSDNPQPGLENVPTLPSLVNDKDRRILQALSFPETVGRPLFMPPGTPKADVDVIRKAFDETMKDPAFLADAKRAKLIVDPLSGQQMEDIIEKAYATPPDLLEEAAPFSGVKGS